MSFTQRLDELRTRQLEQRKQTRILLQEIEQLYCFLIDQRERIKNIALVEFNILDPFLTTTTTTTTIKKRIKRR